MDRSLDSLSSAFYPLACQWIARVVARGVAVQIIQTSRTLAEHQANLASGTSSTSHSLHLPRLMRWNRELAVFDVTDAKKADAMDIAPYEQYSLHGPDKLQWNASDPAWGVIGEEAERLGLRWGGRWKQPFDPGHAELVLPWTVSRLREERLRPWPTFKT
jgi:hypothetical protein